MLYKKLWLNLWVFAVTTFAVVWIEIHRRMLEKSMGRVTTFAVVWIEISINSSMPESARVTTFAVVWIEISSYQTLSSCCICHHLRGGVD